MNSENLFEAVSEIDEKLISRADSYVFKKKKKNVVPFIISLAAVFAIAVTGIALKNNGFFEKPSVISPEGTYEDGSGMVQIGNNGNDEITSGNETLSEKETLFPEEPSKDSITPPIPGTLPTQPLKLTSVSYPSRVQYPLFDFESGEGEIELGGDYSDKLQAWQDQRYELRAMAVDAENIDGFTRKIYEEFLTGNTGENKAVSPLNIYISLSMLAQTADGTTRQQILNLLGVDSIEKLKEQISVLWQKNYINDGISKCLLSNSIWLDNSIGYRKSVLETLTSSYFAESFSGDMGSDEYNEMLNSWLSENTDGLLSPSEEFSERTLFALASTIIFKSKWTDEFDPSSTKTGLFNSPSGEKEAEFMVASKRSFYYWGENYSAVSLSLDSGNMWFILPDEGISADSLFSDSELLDLLSASMPWENAENKKEVLVNMSVPKFDISSENDLISGLENLGLADIADPEKADFSALCENPQEVYISQVKHSVRVMTDEDGVSGAAYTMIDGAGMGPPPEEEVDFVLDRPFLFVITANDMPLFAGVVNEP